MQYDFTSNEQLLMFHLIRLFNKTFWAPAQVSVNRFAAEMHCDKRTVKKSLDGLIEKGLIVSTKNGYLLNTEDTQNDESENDDNGRVESQPAYLRGGVPLSSFLDSEGC